MAKVFITGAADGLGRMAAQLLVDGGHDVVLHARNAARAQDATRAVPGARFTVTGDLGSVAETRGVAQQVNAWGSVDTVIHNAAIGLREPRRITPDGIEHVFATNVLAPYLLTALIHRSSRLVYLSSSMHQDGNADLGDLRWEQKPWNGAQAYADSKLFDVVLACAIARRWPGVLSNAVEPGWVATKMGGPGAPDDLSLGPVTQAWLAVSEEAPARVTGRYFFHQEVQRAHPATSDTTVQDGLLRVCEELTGVAMP